MSPSEFLEIFVSVSLQATLYVCLCGLIVKWTSSDAVRSRIWAACHLGLMILAGLACSLPHYRLVHNVELSDPGEILAIAIRQRFLGQILFAVWAAGASISAAWVFVSAIRMLIFLRRLEVIDSVRFPQLQHLPWSARNQQIRVFTCRSLSSPFCWQFQTPVVVLPESFMEYSPREQELILKHELAHLEANHPLQLFIQRLVQCIYWFHPAIYWMGRQTELSREMMCDAAAAKTREEITDYLRALIRAMDRPVSPVAGVLGTGLLFQRNMSFIAHRARRLTDRALLSAPKSPCRAWLPGCVLLLVTLVSVAWLPVNVLSSSRSNWSACPGWTAEILHDLGVQTRDYEVYEGRLNVFDFDHLQGKRSE